MLYSIDHIGLLKIINCDFGVASRIDVFVHRHNSTARVKGLAAVVNFY